MMSLLLSLVALLQCSNGQFPVECMDDASLRSRECCPGMCSGHGTCTDLNLASLGSNFDHTTVRNNWPYYFTRVCTCDGNYAGFNCSRCKYGYYGESCTESMVLPRRPISDLSDDEWTKYISILRMSRNYDSGYFVFLEEPTGAVTDLTTLPKVTVKLYDLFIWQHHYAAKDNVDSDLYVDYAHEATGFPTWHRQFLLWLEWELQYMIKDTEPDSYYRFRLHYWDWRQEMQTNENSPFKSNRLGETRNVGGFPRVEGDLVKDGWDTKCWGLQPGLICNPNNATGPLQRCPFTGTDPCNINNPDWPTVMDVKTAVQMSSYDGDPHNKLSKSGFRNFMEGFNVLTNSNSDFEKCANNRLCKCETGGPNCNIINGTSPSTPIVRLLHNSVHIIVGIAHFNNQLSPAEKGVLADVAASPSDPMFINHHGMIDCILEEWLQRNPDTMYPQDPNIYQGHKENDYIVPFFPLVRHRDMFKTADKFGYSCSLPDAAIKLGPAPWLLLILGCVFFLI